MNKFMAIVILKPDIEQMQLDYIQSDIINLFEQNTKVQKIWFLGKRKLDYEIKKHTEGLYLKIELLAKSKKLEQLKEQLKLNQYVIFSILINNDNATNNLPILKKQHTLPFRKNSTINNLEMNQPKNKVYMLISKNVKLPFSECNILAISEDVKRIYQYANKKLQEYVFVKGYKTKKAFNVIKDVEEELKKHWKVEFTLGDNTNVGQELFIQEKYLV